MGARGVGGGLGNSGFLLRGWCVSEKLQGRVSRGEGELDGRLGFGHCREARGRGIRVELGAGGTGEEGVRVRVWGCLCEVTGVKVLLWGDKR